MVETYVAGFKNDFIHDRLKVQIFCQFGFISSNI